MKPKVFPSLLAFDFGKLSEEAKKIEQAGADGIHFDVMDGHFVPNLTLGPKALAAVNKATNLFLDVHIMVYNPFDYIEKFVEMGADRITFHLEATEDVIDTIDFIKKCNVEAGLAINPDTPYEMVAKYIGRADLLLFMTVHPGFGGQKFIPSVLDKVSAAKQDRDSQGLKCHIQVDGGIDLQTAKQAVSKGADTLVSGTYLSQAIDLKKAIDELKALG